MGTVDLEGSGVALLESEKEKQKMKSPINNNNVIIAWINKVHYLSTFLKKSHGKSFAQLEERGDY